MSNQVYSNDLHQYFQTEINELTAQLPGPVQTFATQIFGPFSAIPLTLKYVISNNQVYLSWGIASATSTNGTTTAITVNGIPSALIPTRTMSYPCSLIVGNSPTNNIEDGLLTISNVGVVTFTRCRVPPAYPNATVCGVNNGMVLYSLT